MILIIIICSQVEHYFDYIFLFNDWHLTICLMFEMNNECGEGGRLCVLLAQYPEGCFWPGVFVLVRTCPFRSFV